LSKASESQARAIFQEWYGTDVGKTLSPFEQGLLCLSSC
jgi:hypothetical protein